MTAPASWHRRWRRAASACLLCALPLLAAAAPRAWLDRDSIRLGETVTLNVETDARGGSEPDFSVLDADFRRLGTSSNTQLSWVNGKQSARTLWAVALDPRREGTITIPALNVGTEQTAALTLTVLPMPSGGSATAGDEVFLEVEAEPAAPYVQQQVRYRVRLYYALTLLEGQLDEPQVADATLRRLGQDVQYQTTLSGQRYNVVERRYALVPERSARLTVPGPQFRGRALRPGSYGMRGNAILTARGNDIELDVRPRPAPASGPWLPAQSLRLHDESGAAPARVAVGEPITLTLRLAAQGLAAEQLPELQLPAIDGAEVYPDQDSSQTRDDGQWLMGERVRRFAIVPTRAGRLRLPELTLDWWDVANDRRALATLPAREWSVEGAAGASPDAEASADLGPVSATPDADPGGRDAPPHAIPNLWPFATAVFAALWLATLLWRRRVERVPRPPGAAAGAPDAPPKDPANARRALQQALRGGKADAVAHALLALARVDDPACRTLGDVAQRLVPGAQREAVAALERALYRDPSMLPDLSAQLRTAFAAGPAWRHAAGHPAIERDALPPLYPDRP